MLPVADNDCAMGRFVERRQYPCLETNGPTHLRMLREFELRLRGVIELLHNGLSFVGPCFDVRKLPFDALATSL